MPIVLIFLKEQMDVELPLIILQHPFVVYLVEAQGEEGHQGEVEERLKKQLEENLRASFK